MPETPNVGETGLHSIRVNGLRINELPIAEQHQARDQLRLAEDAERQHKIKALMEKSPPYQTSALKAQVKMCRTSLKRAQMVMDQENRTISEYLVHIAMCEQRDKALKELGVELEKL